MRRRRRRRSPTRPGDRQPGRRGGGRAVVTRLPEPPARATASGHTGSDAPVDENLPASRPGRLLRAGADGPTAGAAAVPAVVVDVEGTVVPAEGAGRASPPVLLVCIRSRGHWRGRRRRAWLRRRPAPRPRVLSSSTRRCRGHPPSRHGLRARARVSPSGTAPTTPRASAASSCSPVRASGRTGRGASRPPPPSDVGWLGVTPGSRLDSVVGGRRPGGWCRRHPGTRRATPSGGRLLDVRWAILGLNQ
jgi:hypothetical protein